MTTNDLEYRLRLEIKQQLGKVTKANSPNIYGAIYNANGSLNLQGYTRIETRIIQRVISEQLIPAAAIPQQETEMDE